MALVSYNTAKLRKNQKELKMKPKPLELYPLVTMWPSGVEPAYIVWAWIPKDYDYQNFYLNVGETK